MRDEVSAAVAVPSERGYYFSRLVDSDAEEHHRAVYWTGDHFRVNFSAKNAEVVGWLACSFKSQPLCQNFGLYSLKKDG